MSVIVGIALLSALLAGWLRHGRVAAIGEARLRWLWLAPIALVVQVVLVRSIDGVIPWWVLPVQMGSYALLLAVVVVNRGHFGVPLLGLGLLMNATVMAAHGGLMPQAPETAQLRHTETVLVVGEHIPGTKDVLLPREETRLWWLSDHIMLPTWGMRPMVCSPGDLVLAAGFAATVFGLMTSAPGRLGLLAKRSDLKGITS
jgi:hypothetical protein